MGTLRLVADTPIYTPINGRAKTEASALFAKFRCSGDGHDACVPVAPASGGAEESGSTAHLSSLPSFIEHTFSHFSLQNSCQGLVFPIFIDEEPERTGLAQMPVSPARAPSAM